MAKGIASATRSANLCQRHVAEYLARLDVSGYGVQCRWAMTRSG